MNKTIIATLIASVVLAGCGPSDSEIAAQKDADHKAWLAQFQAQQAQEEAELNKQVAETKAAEDAELVGIITELKKGDPAIKDAYYGYNDKGERTLHVVRDETKDQSQQGYQQGPNGQPVIINNQPAQQASGGVSESVWPLLAGAGAGMLLANAMNSGGGYNSYAQNHRPYSNNYYNDSDYRRERTKVVSNYRSAVTKQTREAYRKSPTYQQKYPAQYQGFQQKAKPVVKPNTNAAIGSSWSQPKTQPTKVKTNSVWGSSQSSTPKQVVSKPVKSNSGWGNSTPSRPAVKPSKSWGSTNYSKPSYKPSAPSRSSFGGTRRR